LGKLKFLIPLSVVMLLWQIFSIHYGEQLVPPPVSVGSEAVNLLAVKENWYDIFITLFRGVAGMAISFCLGFILGLPSGMSRNFMTMISPLVVASQGCPPIIWISLLMVWAGMSSIVPVAVIVISLVPVIFFNIAQGVASLEERLFSMAKIYRVSNTRILKDILLPGIRPYIFSSLSYSLSVAWKVTATAEFFGAPAGIGSRLYWSYRYLDMNQLFFWALVLIIIGFSIEMFIITPLRKTGYSTQGSAA